MHPLSKPFLIQVIKNGMDCLRSPGRAQTGLIRSHYGQGVRGFEVRGLRLDNGKCVCTGIQLRSHTIHATLYYLIVYTCLEK